MRAFGAVRPTARSFLAIRSISLIRTSHRSNSEVVGSFHSLTALGATAPPAIDALKADPECGIAYWGIALGLAEAVRDYGFG